MAGASFDRQVIGSLKHATKQGIVVARRTVAKYRESLLIPPVRQRRAL